MITHHPIILDAPSGPDSIRGGIEMLRRLAESWGVADRLGLLQELGIAPSDDELGARGR